MILARPDYAWLFLLLPLAALGVRLKWTRRQPLAALVPPSRRVGRLMRDGCFLAGLGLVVLAAAGPGIGHHPADATETSGRLVVALDCSKSMWARDVAPDRLTAAKRCLRDILARLPDIQVGLVLFAGKAQLACPVTSDRAGLLLFLDAAGPASMPVGGTNLSAALEAAEMALLDGRGAMLVVSDGEATLTATDATRTVTVPVVTLAVGGESPVTLPDGNGGLLRDSQGRPVEVGLDASALADLANASGGKAFRLAPQTASPDKAVAQTLMPLIARRSGGGATGVDRPIDRTSPCLMLGLVLLLVQLFDFPIGRRSASIALCCAGLALAPPPAMAETTAAEAVAQGLAAMVDGRFDMARDHFLDARARDPDAPTILFDLGTASYRLGQFDRAFVAFARAARASTGKLRADALYNQGNAAYRLGKTETAIASYEAALRLAPNDADAKANLEFLRTPKTSDNADASQARSKETASRPGTGNESAEPDQSAPSAQAPPPQGQADGSETSPEQPAAAPATTPAGDRPDPDAPTAPLAADKGQVAGIRRAQPDAKPGTPLLDKVPDLPGLPLIMPTYGRPNVEKDW